MDRHGLQLAWMFRAKFADVFHHNGGDALHAVVAQVRYG